MAFRVRSTEDDNCQGCVGTKCLFTNFQAESRHEVQVSILIILFQPWRRNPINLSSKYPKNLQFREAIFTRKSFIAGRLTNKSSASIAVVPSALTFHCVDDAMWSTFVHRPVDKGRGIVGTGSNVPKYLVSLPKTYLALLLNWHK